jgi:hypothetical protein
LQSQQHVVRQARRGRPIELARLRARRLHQLRKRIHLQQGRRRHAEKVIDHWCDRHQVGGRIVRQALVQQGIERDHAGEGEQEGVVVACAEERTDGGNAVGALAVLHHDGLAPAFAQPLGDEAPCQVRTAAGRQWNDEPHGLFRPALERRLGRWLRQRRTGDER